MTILDTCPLPWCTKSKPELMQGGFRNGSFVVRCDTCGCETPRFYEADSAIRLWNARAASADTHPQDGDVKQAPLVSGAVGAAETPKGQTDTVKGMDRP